MKHCLLGLLFAAIGCAQESVSAGPSRAIEVRVTPAEMHTFQRVLKTVGVARPISSVEVTANVTERIASIHFRDGETVKKGALLAVLEGSEEQANLAEAQAQLRAAESEWGRVQNLQKAGAITPTEIDLARERLEGSRSRLDQLGARVRDRVIRAPFDGQLGLRQVSPGSLLEPNTVITTLDDNQTMLADFDVPAPQTSAVRVGQTVHVTPLSGDELEGLVSAVQARLDPLTGSAKARAKILNPDGVLKAGATLRVAVDLGARPSLAVPVLAIISKASRHYVFAVEDDKAVQKEVTLGFRDADWVEVTGGLDEDAQVIVEGSLKVQSGSEVKIITERADVAL